MVHKINKVKKDSKFRKGIHKISVNYNIDKEVEKTKKAYADSFNYPKNAKFDSPKYKKWWEKVEKERILDWKGTSYMYPHDWMKVGYIVGKYNEFDPKIVGNILKKYPESKVKLAREGSVVIYIDYGKYDPNKIMKDMKTIGKADEIDIVEKGFTMPKFSKSGKIVRYKIPFPEETNKVIRVWWD